jgi:hypothetical protein
MDFAEYVWPVVEPAIPFVKGWALEAICEHQDRAVGRLPPSLKSGPVRTAGTAQAQLSILCRFFLAAEGGA